MSTYGEVYQRKILFTMSTHGEVYQRKKYYLL